MIISQSWNFLQDPPIFNLPGGSKRSFIKLSGSIIIHESIIIDDRSVNMIMQCRQGLNPVIEKIFQVKQGHNEIILDEFEASGYLTIKFIFENESLPSGWYPIQGSQIKFSLVAEKRF